MSTPRDSDYGLTAQRLREVLAYDRDTGQFRWLKTYQRRHVGRIAGCVSRYGYTYIMINRRKYFVHRLAWLYVKGVWPEKQIDHINGERSDNRWVNLREATPSQNKANCFAPVRNKSGFKGVRWDKKLGKWGAQIRTDGRIRWLGTFPTPEDAHRAYAAAAVAAHGEFARV